MLCKPKLPHLAPKAEHARLRFHGAKCPATCTSNFLLHWTLLLRWTQAQRLSLPGTNSDARAALFSNSRFAQTSGSRPVPVADVPLPQRRVVLTHVESRMLQCRRQSSAPSATAHAASTPSRVNANKKPRAKSLEVNGDPASVATV